MVFSLGSPCESVMIQRKMLEEFGISVPDDATAFFTLKSSIVFLVPAAEEDGNSIVFYQLEIEEALTDEQIELLKKADCFEESEVRELV